ncbi:hypothetical protein Acr_11g0011010 [Actinidia rufa]|uniref:RNase H type-1 domain-containing protein n=1 Tax=Actinidia rufa TaxID=165716 RepID=A0A7J0FDN2_9ERIC|nr:hypothetical protein Acr_11g0011010 [Actinidia rufa]
MGTPLPFTIWLNHLFADAPDEDAILKAISILWTIWCNRNKAAFDRSLTPEEGLASIRHSWHEVAMWKAGRSPPSLGAIDGNRGSCTRSHSFTSSKTASGNNPCMATHILLVVDGAWKALSLKVAAAWACALSLDLCNSRSSLPFLLTASEVEPKACYEALLWAMHHGHWNVKLSTDCLEVIQGLRNYPRVNLLLAGLLGDTLHLLRLCTFFNVVSFLLGNNGLSPDGACGWEFFTKLRRRGPSLLPSSSKAEAPALARPDSVTVYFIPLQLSLSSRELGRCSSRSCELDVFILVVISALHFGRKELVLLNWVCGCNQRGKLSELDVDAFLLRALASEGSLVADEQSVLSSRCSLISNDHSVASNKCSLITDKQSVVSMDHIHYLEATIHEDPPTLLRRLLE